MDWRVGWYEFVSTEGGEVQTTAARSVLIYFI
jgi:hypothetical protein